MPLVDSNDPALWDGGASSLYRAFPSGQQLGYVREAASCYLGNDYELLIAALESKGMTRGQRIAVIGAGFGWGVEKLLAAGFGPMADGTSAGRLMAVDTSTYIQNNKVANATIAISSADVNASTGRKAVRDAFNLSGNTKIDWIVTEDVLPLLTGSGSVPSGNNEVVPFCQNLRTLAVNVAHWISLQTASSDPRLNWKTLQEWKVWCSPDLVISRSDGAVL